MASITRQVSGEPESPEEPLDPARSTIALADDIFIGEGPPPSEPAPSKALTRSERGDDHRARGRSGSLRRRLVGGDIVALCLVWGVQAVTHGAGGVATELALGALAVVVTLFVMQCAGLYRSRVCAQRSLEAFRVVIASAIGTAAFISCDAIVERISVVGPLEAGAAAVLAILLLRWRFNRWLLARRSASKFLRTVVMVGTNEDAEALWRLLSDEPELGYRVGGVAGEPQSGAPWEGLPTCTGIERLGELAKQVDASGVIIVASSLVGDERKETVDGALAAGLHVQVWAGLDGFSSRRTRMAPVSGVPLLYVEPKDIAAWQLVIKRGMDILLAAVLLVLTSPLLAAAALAIKLTDRGPRDVPKPTGRPLWQTDHDPQTAHHGPQRRADDGECRRAEREDRRPAVQGLLRPARHQNRSPPTGHKHRRATPAVERLERDYEPGRPKAGARARSRTLRLGAAETARDAPGDHGVVASRGARQPVV